jgi:hypothetical protein
MFSFRARIVFVSTFCSCLCMHLSHDPHAANVFSLPKVIVPQGATGQSLFFQCEHDVALAAFSVSILYDPLAIQITDVTTAGTSADSPDFFGGSNENGHLTYGVVLGVGPTAVKLLPPSANDKLLRLTLDTLVPAPAQTSLRFIDGLKNGSFPSSNTITNDIGRSVSPVFQDGLITISQVDNDNDGVPDGSDNCPTTPNADQVDTEGDGIGNVCDDDDDNDGVLDVTDDCSLVSNPNQADTDDDGLGNACDEDDDQDGVPDTSDNCPLVKNTDQLDADLDGIGDACDTLTDRDGDGIADVVDNCSVVSNPNQVDSDKDGIGDACDTDNDNDGVPDAQDNCPTVPNPDLADRDADGLGNACDDDDDQDGILDPQDNCPLAFNPGQTDVDGDGIGDVCDSLVDHDADGIPDASDNCSSAFNPNQEDNDGDGLGNACDSDDDQDGVPDAQDNCPLTPNADQTDADLDGIGDACDTFIDRDGDGIANATDNCPLVVNPDQKDTDGDGRGDACDSGLPPVANAGVDQVMPELSSVTLDASLSASPENQALSFHWTQVSGPPALLTGVDTARPTFTVPQVSEDTELVFEVEVSDGSSSDVDRVTVLVIDLERRTGSLALLPGSGSTLIESGTRALVFQGQISWNGSLTNTPEDALWTKMRFTGSGAGDESKLLTGATLYSDTNQNGSLDSEDEPIGPKASMAPGNSALEFNFSKELAANSTRSFFLVVDLAAPVETTSALFFPALLAAGGGLWRLLRHRARSHRASSRRAASLLPLLGVAILFCLPLGAAACGGGGGGGGGGNGGPPPAVSREIRFGILTPSDIELRGKLTGVAGAVHGLPIQGAPLDV